MYNHDAQGSRYNHAETVLSPATVGDLQVQWSLPTRGAVAGTPAVVNDIVYVADAAGWVYAASRDGDLLWEKELPGLDAIIWGAKVTASLLVTNRTAIVGDLGGSIHGLDIATGDVKWTTRPPSPGPIFGEQHPFQSIFGSPTMVGPYVAMGISSLEEVAVLFPDYPCCTFRGSLVLLDPSGSLVWQTFTTDAPTFQDTDGDPSTIELGPSGAAIWTTPTFDRASNTIFATTGNNYSQPTTETSDAIIAFDAADGHIKWDSQKTANDFWNFRYPPQEAGDPPDFDFGDSPQVYKIGGRTVVGAGQKSGFYHVVDAATGERINEFQATEIGGNLGGLFADSAVVGGVAFTNGSIWADPFGSPDPPEAGIISAIAADGSAELWRIETDGSPNVSGVAVANGVVYFQSTTSGTVYAVAAADGDILATVDINACDGSSPVCGQTSGPSISRGQVYVGVGDVMTGLFNPFLAPGPGALVALGLDSPPHGHGPANSHGADAALAWSLTGESGQPPRSAVASLVASDHLQPIPEPSNAATARSPRRIVPTAADAVHAEGLPGRSAQADSAAELADWIFGELLG